MPETENALLLVGDALLYFVALAALLRARSRIGLGAFFCALGVMHFLETYLASIFYVALPYGIVTSPGSTVLFTGKLMLLLLLYIREDAVVVRQPIYGLLFGNVLVFALGFMLRNHTPLPLSEGRVADFGFLNEMGGLMVWGTAILFFDCIVIILLYERSRAWFGDHVFPRLLLCSALVLTFDQVAFFAGLTMLTGAGLPVLIGGWIAKMGAVALYSVLGTIYLQYFERPLGFRRAPRIWDVFDTLTYRERYEDLLARTGCDALTGALDRHSLESYGRRAVENAAAAGRPLALLLIDIDHFKAFNDRFGHAAGDKMLKRVTSEIMAAARVSDFTYRYGGEEFVVIADGLATNDAIALGERVRRGIAGAPSDDPARKVTASIGIATCAGDASGYDRLFEIADKRLYEAKALGRNRVIGARPPNGENPMRLVKG
ncbi:MAG TPA: GGDEF domain-containing protein [Pseudolabrys sp.]|nr:GGDEF domain-containing protein [Pseudolabrys sp.]